MRRRGGEGGVFGCKAGRRAGQDALVVSASQGRARACCWSPPPLASSPRHGATPQVPIVGLAQRNRKYKPVRPGSSWAAHKPRSHNDFGIPGATTPLPCQPFASGALALAHAPLGAARGWQAVGSWQMMTCKHAACCLALAEGYDDGSHISSGEVGLLRPAALPRRAICPHMPHLSRPKINVRVPRDAPRVSC